MTGIEEFIASAIAAATAAAPEVAAAGAASALPGAALGGTLVAAAAPVATGLTLAEAAAVAGGVSAVGGTAAQLLADKPKATPTVAAPTKDLAQTAADQQSQLYRKRGRASSILAGGKPAGSTSSPALGAAGLLGS